MSAKGPRLTRTEGTIARAGIAELTVSSMARILWTSEAVGGRRSGTSRLRYD